MSDSADDVDLVTRCLAGNDDAVREFIARFQRMIFSLSYRMMGNYEDAEDASQESLVRALRGLPTWDQSRPLKPWLLTITANRCRTALMKRNRRPIPVEFVIDPATIDRSAHRSDLSEELELALAELKPEHRECFLLFHEHQLNCAEVGEVLGAPEGTIKTWLHRTRRQLADYLKRRGIVPEPSYEF